MNWSTHYQLRGMDSTVCHPGSAAWHSQPGLTFTPAHWLDGYDMLMCPNKAETAVHGCHCRSDMVLRMRKVLATPRSWLLITFRMGRQASVRFISIILPRIESWITKTLSHVKHLGNSSSPDKKQGAQCDQQLEKALNKQNYPTSINSWLTGEDLSAGRFFDWRWLSQKGFKRLFVVSSKLIQSCLKGSFFCSETLNICTIMWYSNLNDI